jgi:hypothetical protein
MIVCQCITTPNWETFSVFVSPEDGQDEEVVWSNHPDFLT